MLIVIGQTVSDINPWHLFGLLWLAYLHPSTRAPLHALVITPAIAFLRAEILWHTLLVAPVALVLLVARPRALGRVLRALPGRAAALRAPGSARDFLRGFAGVAGSAAAHVRRAGPARGRDTGREALAHETARWLRYYAYVGALAALAWATAAWAAWATELAVGGFALARGQPLVLGGVDVAASAPRPWGRWPGCYFRDEPALWTSAQEPQADRPRWLYGADGVCSPIVMYV